MPRRPHFEPILTGDGWMVSVPAGMSGKGRRERRFFAEPKAAEKFAARMRSVYHRGERGGIIPHALALDAAAAAEVLKPHGISLLEAARAAAERIAAAGTSERFRDRYDRAVRENEGRWSDRYMADMERLPRWVGRELMGRKVAEIDEAMVLAALRAHGASAQSTVDARRRYVRAVLQYRTKHHRQVKVEILTPGQCARMLRACESAEERMAVGLLLWAGIRPSAEDGEIIRMDWEQVGKKEIHVPEWVAKTKTDRHVPITPRLERLLRGHPASGPVVPANWRRVYRRLRAAVGGLEGKQDITRHTFASNYLAAFGDAATKQALGHTAGSDTLFRHYRRAVTEEAGRRFFR